TTPVAHAASPVASVRRPAPALKRVPLPLPLALSAAWIPNRRRSTRPPPAIPVALATSSCSYAKFLDRTLQRAVVRIQFAGLVEEASRLLLVAHHPQHFADMRGDFRILAQAPG